MKRILICLILSLTFIFSGCGVKVYNPSNEDGKSSKVPTTLVNTSNEGEIETDLTKLYDSCVKSVVTVLNYASYYDRGQTVTGLYGSGSGFIYASDDTYLYLSRIGSSACSSGS